MHMQSCRECSAPDHISVHSYSHQVVIVTAQYIVAAVYMYDARIIHFAAMIDLATFTACIN